MGTQPPVFSLVDHSSSIVTITDKMSDTFPEIKSKESLVAKYVTEPLWEKLGKMETKTSQFTLSKAIACAVQFDNQHCGIYAGDWDSYKDFSEVFDPLIQDYHGISAEGTPGQMRGAASAAAWYQGRVWWTDWGHIRYLQQAQAGLLRG